MSTNAIKGKEKQQIAKVLYLKHKKMLRKILQMGEFKFGGRNSEQFLFFKKTCMNIIYDNLNEMFRIYLNMGIIEECGCGSSLEKRKGSSYCLRCNGCGFKNSEQLNDSLATLEGWDENPQKMLNNMLKTV